MRLTLFKIILWIIVILMLLIYLFGIGIVIMYILYKLGVPDKYYGIKQLIVALVTVLLAKFTFLPAIDIVGKWLKRVFKMNQSRF